MMEMNVIEQDDGWRNIMPELIRVLVPVSGLDEAKLLIPIVQGVLQEYQGELTILSITKVPEGFPMSQTAAKASRGREAFCKWLSKNTQIAANVKTMVCPSRDVWAGIWRVVKQEGSDLLIVSLPVPGLGQTVVSKLIDPRLTQPPCDVVVVRPGRGVAGDMHWGTVKRILLPVRGGPRSSLALRVGCVLADCAAAEISLLHVTSPANRKDRSQFGEEFRSTLHGIERVTRSITAKGEVLPIIQEEIRDHQAIVLGAPSQGGGNWKSPLLAALMKDTDVSLVIVKERAQSVRPSRKKANSVSITIKRPITAVVDKWFAESTYHSREFADLERLLALKEQQGLTISLGLPALNEEKTVGKVIQTVKTALMDEVTLLDEIVLIDSSSTDSTREIAKDLGIPVYLHQEILPQYGAYHGKGEALWKSLYILEGDLIAWIDTDIKNIHPRFVYGVIGPMLRDPDVQYVKGFYRRPLKQGDKIVAGGGGRVTELTARPFINLFFPQLSGLIQPLSGEYAGRRSALEQLPFFTGYGVETGLLIDILEIFGLNAIAQVDLLERIHHNQPLPSLSKMSFAIMQVVFGRLERRHNVDLLHEANLTMNLIRYRPRRRYFLEPEKVRERERPPMITIEEYRHKHDLSTKEGMQEIEFFEL